VNVIGNVSPNCTSTRHIGRLRRCTQLITLLSGMSALLLVCAAGASGQDPPARTPPLLVPQLQGSDHVELVALTADAGRLVTIGSDGDVRRWDVATGRVLSALTLPEHTFSKAVSSDGRWLVASDRNVAVLWDLTVGKEVRRYKGHSDEVVSAVISADGKWLASGTADGRATLWQLADGTRVRDFEALAPQINSLALTSDGARLVAACGSRDDSRGFAVEWDVHSGKEVHRFRTHDGAVIVARLSADDKWLATVGADGFVRLWDMASGMERRVFTLRGGPRGVRDFVGTATDVVVARGGDWLVFGGDSDLWRAEGKKAERTFDAGGFCGVSRLLLTKDEKRLVTVAGGHVRLWDVKSGELVRSFHSLALRTGTLALSGDGKWLATGSDRDGDETARLWDLTAGKQVRTFKHAKAVEAVVLSHDGRRLATDTIDEVHVWDTTTGKKIHPVSAYAQATGLGLTPDGRLLVTPGILKEKDRPTMVVRVTDLADGKPLHELRGHDRYPNVIALSRDGKHLVTTSHHDHDGQVICWELPSGKRLSDFRVGDAPVLAVLGDGKQVAVANPSRRGIRLVATDTGKKSAPLPLDKFEIFKCIAVSSDDRWLAAGGLRGAVHVWDLTTRKQAHVLRGHRGRVLGVAFTPDARRLATTGDDQTTRFWDLKSGEELCRLLSFRDGTWAVLDRAGRYDAANDGDVQGLHWVVEKQLFPVTRYRNRAFDPGLLAKHLGFASAPLRKLVDR
jgi:WD40 repeat protein